MKIINKEGQIQEIKPRKLKEKELMFSFEDLKKYFTYINTENNLQAIENNNRNNKN